MVCVIVYVGWFVIVTLVFGGLKYSKSENNNTCFVGISNTIDFIVLYFIFCK